MTTLAGDHSGRGRAAPDTGQWDVLTGFPEYATTSRLDELRASEYSRLDAAGQVYLDFTGSSLYADSQLRRHFELLSGQILGNPHSVSPASSLATDLVEQARRRVLDWFNACPEEYVAIFTANASAALKLVAEAYPFRPGSRFLLTSDNHNSVNGMRQYARNAGADVTYVPLVAPTLRVHEDTLFRHLEDGADSGPGLFAYPAQSNFTGVQHPFSWVERAHERGWYVLVDGSAYVATNRLDLGAHHPDFVPLSFYKMFGYPTGVGCLLARREALEALHRPWFSGGTVVAVAVEGDAYRLAPGYAGFEDGTLNFLSLPAVEIGLDHLESIGIDTIHTRVRCLTDWLLHRMATLRHQGGTPVVRIYGPTTWDRRGATVAFNFLDPAGRVVDERVVDRWARALDISLRTGCFCNPGAGETAFGVEPALTARILDEHALLTADDYIRLTGLESGGAIRLSLGLVSNVADVERFVELAEKFQDAVIDEADLPPRHGC